tara:strand:- start:2982 stop:3344 length:363 start_codon:yes stop_codon:yes gene_type:complete
MKNLNSAKELKTMTQDATLSTKSVAELELLMTNVRKEIRIKMVEELQTGPKVVTFTKVNGDQRVMTCTLKEDLIPSASKADPLSQKKIRAISDEVIPVWDVNAEGWRSFRVDSVTGFNVA